MLDKTEMISLIVDKLGLRELKTAEQGVIIRRLEANIASRINIAILERLAEADHAELLRLAETSNEGLDKFLQTKIPDLDDLMKKVAAEAVAEFKTLSRQA